MLPCSKVGKKERKLLRKFACVRGTNSLSVFVGKGGEARFCPRRLGGAHPKCADYYAEWRASPDACLFVESLSGAPLPLAWLITPAKTL